VIFHTNGLHKREQVTNLSLRDRAAVSDDVSNRSAKRLHRPLSLGSDLPHLDELLVHSQLGRNELISRLLGLRGPPKEQQRKERGGR
jgi:hypothetical protein